MKKVCLSLTMVMALLVSSVAPSSAQKIVNFNEQFTINTLPPVLNYCTTDLVDLDGELHAVVSGNINGNKIWLTLHVNFQNLSGLGQLTGNTYSGGGAANVNINEAFFGSFNGHLVASTVLTTAKKDNNLFVKIKFHVTVSSSGVVTLNVVDVTVDCK